MAKKQAQTIRITAKENGLWRGGKQHEGTKNYPITAFTEEELRRVRSEPLLIVEEINSDDQLSETS